MFFVACRLRPWEHAALWWHTLKPQREQNWGGHERSLEKRFF